MATQDQSVKSLLAELVNNVTRLVRQELQLVQVETSEKTSQALEGVFVIIGGLLLAFAALLILLQAVVVGLSEFVDPWLASLIVGVVVAVIAFALRPTLMGLYLDGVAQEKHGTAFSRTHGV